MNLRSAISLYSVSSPLQLLAAMEAANRIPAAKHILLIRTVNEERAQHMQQMNSLLSLYAWDEILYWPRFKEKSLAGRIQATSFIRRLARRYRDQCKNFLYGGFGWVKNHSLRSLLEPENVYMLDDGTATIHQHKAYLSKGVKLTSKVTNLYSNRGIRSWLTNLLYPIDQDRINGSITIFTSFDIQENQEAGVRVLKHSFEFIGQSSAEKQYSGSSAFYFGSPLSEKKLMDSTDEIEHIGAVYRYYSDKQVGLIYVSHRDDSEEKLKALERLGIEHINLDMPAELYFATEEELPLHVASSSSTALHNVTRICREIKPLLFSIASHIQNSDRKRALEAVEDHYQAIGIPVLELHAGSWQARGPGS